MMTLIYSILLFIVYQFLFIKIGFSINTSVYGLFLILLFCYHLTDNLDIRKKRKYDSIFINFIVFLIFVFFYKKIELLVLFFIFTLVQKIICYGLRKISKINIDFEEYNKKNTIKLLLDCFGVVLGITFSYILKYDIEIYNYLKLEYLITYLSVFVVGYSYLKMSQKSWSYTNILDILNLLILNLIAVISFEGIILINKDKSFPSTLVVTIYVITLSCQLLFRYVFRLKRYYKRGKKVDRELKKTLVYGAGEAGALLAQEYLKNPNFSYEIVGFIDDDVRKIGTSIYNIPILGDRASIEKIVCSKKIEELLIAIPSLSGNELANIVDSVQKVGDINVKLVPGIIELLSNKSILSQIRNVKIEDLLGREEIIINDENIKNLIENKVIVVTGGAGSIGSELSRQVAKYNPKLLVMIDINENDIYFLELELKRKYPTLQLISEICNIREKDKVDFLFDKYRPNVVFHAAAHKHVPLMEHNPEEAIKNNIFGTKNVAECAEKYGVERMVLISTDKAVNPTNLMGATKRACELVIEQMNKTSTHTKFMAVRFGNVLGSNGSVIPIFRKLIAEGKNLTLTHREITRYFMTIPEAAQLVIEAGSLGNGGEIFILDMGEPIKIYDLAEKMIKLSNAKVGIDIIGLRPGEKLFEELLYDVNSAIKTSNKKIFITKIEDGNVNINEYFDRLEEVIKKPNKEEIKKIMKEVVISYKEVKY